MKSILSIINLKKEFRTKKGESKHILDIPKLDITEHQFVTILGPSGCGKTTLLNLIAGFIKPSKGSILFEGKKIDCPDVNRGVVFQEYAIFPWMTVYDNIILGLISQGCNKDFIKSSAQKFIRLVGLDKVTKLYPYQLSGGMKQRVAIARSLIMNPKILLMDEPFGALDAQMRENLQNELKKIYRDTKKTIIFVTHNIEESIFLGNRLIVMKAGKNSIKMDLNINFDNNSQKNSGLIKKVKEQIRSQLK